MQLIKLIDGREPHFSIRTRDPDDPPARCDGYRVKGGGVAETVHARGCDGHVEPGDQYLVVWRVPGQVEQFTTCSKCALAGHRNIVERDGV